MQKYRALLNALASIEACGAWRNAGPLLDAATEKAAADLRAAGLSEVPAFSTSGNPEILPSLASHGGEHIREIRRLVDDGEVGDFAFVADHARKRAEQHFPLEAILHAYRCGHRVLSH